MRENGYNISIENYKTLLRRVNKNDDEEITKDEFFNGNFIMPTLKIDKFDDKLNAIFY